MSKIGRKPIKVTSAQVDIKGNTITIKGANGTVTHELPDCLTVAFENGQILIDVKENNRENRMVWGLHRALIANKVTGIETGFKQDVNIVGLGYKAQPSGDKLIFTLGFSHKVDFAIPEGVKIEVNKTGQKLTVTSNDKFLLGNACDKICALKRPEPYKGTGIMLEGQVIRRKAGKAKSA